MLEVYKRALNPVRRYLYFIPVSPSCLRKV